MTRITLKIDPESQQWQVERYARRIAAIVSGSGVIEPISGFSWSIDLLDNDWWMQVDAGRIVITFRRDKELEILNALRAVIIHFCRLEKFNKTEVPA